MSSETLLWAKNQKTPSLASKALLMVLADEASPWGEVEPQYLTLDWCHRFLHCTEKQFNAAIGQLMDRLIHPSEKLNEAGQPLFYVLNESRP